MEEALESLRRADCAGHGPLGRHRERAPIPDTIRRAERQVALAPRLPAVLKGTTGPRTTAEGLDLARLCLDRDRPAAAARLYADAFAADPGLAEERGRPRHRLAAARAAALAGRGKGRDDPPPDAEAQAASAGRRSAGSRRSWRPGRRSWIRATGAAARRRSPRWSHGDTDPDLAGVREPEALAALPEAERAGWRALWAAVDALRKRTGTPPP